MSVCDIEQTIKSMSDQEKYHILKNHAEQTKNYSFPTPYDGGCFGSVGREGACCKLCSLFAKSKNNLGAVVNKPFITWHKKIEYLSMCAKNQYRTDVRNAAMDFTNKTQNPPSTIILRTQSQRKENYETNVNFVLYCGRQCVAFRTMNHGNLDGKQNAGSECLLFVPGIQNELINIVGKDLILIDTISEIND